MRRSTLPIAVLVALLTVSCADDGDEGGSADGGTLEGATLEGVTWVLQRESIDELVADAPEDARVDLVMEGDRASGASGCNQYMGSFQADGSSISFGELGGTQMACAQPLMDLETAYLTALGAVTEYEVRAGELMLMGGDVHLAFITEAPPQPLPLVGTAWSLEALGTGGDAVSSPVAGTEVSLELADDESAAGSGGCNQYNTSYELDGSSISFGPIASTRMACETDVMDQEAALFGALESAAAYEIVGDVLTLNDADGGFLVSFRGA